MRGCSVKPIRVLHLRDTYEIGGPGKTILETFRAIDASRFELHLGVFLTHAESAEMPFTTAATAVRMPVHEIRGAHPYDLRMVQRVAELVDRLGVDIVHAHEVKSDVIAYLTRRVRRVAIVTTLHGWIAKSTKARVLTALDKRIVRGFDRVIAVSGPIHSEMAALGAPKSRLRLVHNAIVVENYRRTGQTGYVRSLTGRPAEGPVLASIGRLSPEKGHADLVEALAIAARRGCRVTTILAGDGPAKRELTERVRALGLSNAVHFPGYESRPQRLLEETDLMVLPSHTEGLPNAVLEAHAMEVPVLATRVGGTPEVIADNETGRLVPAHAPDALAEGIVAFVRDPLPWRRMAKAGREMVERRFDFKARTRRLEAIYAEVVEEMAR